MRSNIFNNKQMLRWQEVTLEVTLEAADVDMATKKKIVEVELRRVWRTPKMKSH
jgi:hypothetical protein